MSNTPKYIVVKSPYSFSRATTKWAILNTETGKIEEAGFSSADRALEYIWREYTHAT